MYELLTLALSALFRQPSFLQAHHEHDENVYPHAISAHFHPALVPHDLPRALGYHCLLYGGRFLCFRIPMHSSATSLG